MLARTILLSLGLFTFSTTSAAAEPEAPTEEHHPFHVDARTSAGASLSTDGDDAYSLGAHVLARKGWVTFGLAGETAGYAQGNGRQLGAAVAGATWESRRFRVTGLGLFGVHRWMNPGSSNIGRERYENTAFVGARTDLELRALTLGPIELSVGVWASAAIDLHHERLPNTVNYENISFIKGEKSGATGLSAGLTF